VDTTVTEKSQTALALASMVSGSYFSMLGARAELGLVLALADVSSRHPSTLPNYGETSIVGVNAMSSQLRASLRNYPFSSLCRQSYKILKIVVNHFEPSFVVYLEMLQGTSLTRGTSICANSGGM
jgi:hypothetical protein